jgi:peptidyl-prolyl cis-trans isomerase SurA
MRFLALRYMYLIALAFATFLAVSGSALAQDTAVLVNGEPITSYDITQRTLWQNLTSGNFGERMKALLNSGECRPKYSEGTPPAQPRSQAEAEQAAERIKKETIACAKRRVLSEGGATRQAVIEALIDDKLKLQAAKRLGIEISDEEIEGYLVERQARTNAASDGAKPDVCAFYAQLQANGISRKAVQDVIRPQLAWLALIRRTYKLTGGPETKGGYESFSRNYLEKLKPKAVIEYRDSNQENGRNHHSD